MGGKGRQMWRKLWRAMWGWGILLAAMTGCASSSSGIELNELEGRWEWRSASGGIAGRTITPASEGYTMELRFQADGDAELYRNGALRSTATYRIGLGRQDGSFPGREVVTFTPALFGWGEMALHLEGGDRLTFSDGCCDGFSYGFVRVGSGG